MLYYLFEYLDKYYDLTGAGLFKYISFRSAIAFIISLLFSMIYGKKIINYLQLKQVGESVRDLGLTGQVEKAGTPTMGGIIIILATLIPVLLFAQIDNVYIVLLVVTTLWMGTIGFLDDYIKIFKQNKAGLKGRFKILGQITLGIFVGAMLYFHPSVTMKEKLPTKFQYVTESGTQVLFADSKKSTKTTIPFVKNNELDYASALAFLGKGYKKYAWVIFIPIVIFIITAVSNGANLTDGIDGLAAGLVGHHSIDARDFCMGFRKYHFRELFGCHVHS